MEQRERGQRLVPQENTIITPIEAGCYKQKIPHRDASEEEKEGEQENSLQGSNASCTFHPFRQGMIR
jgi:hypothetical protein